MKQLDIKSLDKDQLCRVAKAMSSEARIDILHLLQFSSLSVNEIAAKLDMPMSSTALNINILEQADLIRTETQPGARGKQKVCNLNKDRISVEICASPREVREIESFCMPIGAFTACEIHPTCGMADDNGYLINEDTPSYFYMPNRLGAKIIWTARGFLEYNFPNPTLELKKKIICATLRVEICSEAAGYREEWKSDITLWINGVECTTWQSPGDFGSRRGRLNPDWWMSGNTQHGLLTSWSIDESGCYINGTKTSKITISDLALETHHNITIRLGNKNGVQHAGGLVLFGNSFGDFGQDIVLALEYQSEIT